MKTKEEALIREKHTELEFEYPKQNLGLSVHNYANSPNLNGI